MKSTKSKEGIIVLLDALGVSSDTIEDSERFIQVLNKIIEISDQYFKSVIKRITEHNIDEYRDIVEHYKSTPHEVRTFGDTLLFSWEKTNWVSDKRLFFIMGYLVSFIIAKALSLGVILEDP